MSCEIRQWKWGSYSLLRDDDLKNAAPFTLDVSLFCNGTNKWSPKFGGSTVYVAKGETEQVSFRQSIY